MKLLSTLSLILFLSASLLAQNNAFVDQTFKVQNHGKDYLLKDFYVFGQKPKLKDKKYVSVNDSILNENASFNGIIVSVYVTDNIGWVGRDDDKYLPYLHEGSKSAEYRFDWMLSPTEVDEEVVEDFIAFIAGLPGSAIVSMYSGYYHAIDQMPESFFEAVETYRSEEIRNLKANSVWAFIGSKCNYETIDEAVTDKQDEVIEVSFSPLKYCGPLSTALPKNKELQVKVFPNPVDKYLSISMNPEDANAEVSIYDLTGQVQIRTMQTDRIDITDLSKGVFIVQVKTNGKTYSSRITKR